MAKVKVRLTHTCNMPAHPGAPGDVVIVDEALAAQWAASGGCVPIEQNLVLREEASSAAQTASEPPAPPPARPARSKAKHPTPES